MKSDWGNLFGAGWHTPSKDEWNYLCNTRSTASGVRYAKATVNGVPGVILLPDDWSTSYYTLASTNTATAAFSANNINSTTWINSLEAHGAVFLPIAGLRSFENIWNVGGQGFYWSSSPGSNVNCAYTMTFHATAVEPQWTGDDIYRGYGMSVRLIKDMPIDVTGVTLSPTEASLIVGETTTLTPTVAPATATDMTVTWTTSDDAVATVSDGVVTAVGAGTATITVTATNGTADTSDDKTATCTVTVSYPTYDLTANPGADGEYWATFYSDASNYEASEGTKVFAVNLTDAEITMTEISDGIVKSGEGVVLKNTSASITMTPTASAGTGDWTDNSLTGTMTSITNPGNAYVLNKKDGTGVGFYRLSSGGTIGANKAYLTYSGTLAREFFLFDEATGISATLMNNEEVNGEVYDLQGRRVSQPTKGLYIVNGKKYIKK